jgi:diaminohydroxyphosphoribosylaminopyrimidine deaminase/5-amino-6-(5-phosphoribosylamino)uracil reductase
MMFVATDHRHMARALQLAARGLFTADPNPRVGCVLVRDGQVVGEGWHERAGEPHAEIHALAQAAEQARGATAYVSLEPCSHQGRTPPCSTALIEAGVVRVIAAMEDPNPLVAGSGLAALRQAGIEVGSGLLAAEAAQLNPGFVKRMRSGLPWVRCKLAMSLDGRTAMASGESRWITGEAARRDVQRLRARSSAVLTGIGTVLADDPSMNVRLEDAGKLRQPWRVVLDSQLRMPAAARMLAPCPGRMASSTWQRSCVTSVSSSSTRFMSRPAPPCVAPCCRPG